AVVRNPPRGVGPCDEAPCVHQIGVGLVRRNKTIRDKIVLSVELRWSRNIKRRSCRFRGGRYKGVLIAAEYGDWKYYDTRDHHDDFRSSFHTRLLPRLIMCFRKCDLAARDAGPRRFIRRDSSRGS